MRGVVRQIGWYGAVLRAISWADVIHHHYNASALPYDVDLRYAAWLGKARVVEFWGSDIRIPEIASADNPYAAQFYRTHTNAVGAHGCTPRETQERFARYGFQCLVPGLELPLHVYRDLFPSPYSTRQRIILADYQPEYPALERSRPLVVHSATKKDLKGTDAVLRAVETLRGSLRFDFRLVHDVERSEALAIRRKCDVFLDQFVLGNHGLGALEAMAYGKPTVCYIRPTLVPKFPADFPIVNATQENLAGVLQELLEDAPRRHEIGRRSRAYVEKYHDAHKLARQLVGIYEELLERARPGRNRASR